MKEYRVVADDGTEKTVFAGMPEAACARAFGKTWGHHWESLSDPPVMINWPKFAVYVGDTKVGDYQEVEHG